jgi:molybdopterin-guanine dinucleotide biosynthesis protein A
MPVDSEVAVNLLGVVLVGGQSKRMGQDKAALRTPLGQSLLDRSLSALDPFCRRLAVCGGPSDRLLADPQFSAWLARGRTTVLADPRTGLGPLAGLASALAFAESHQCDGCLLLAVDLVNIDQPALRALVSHPREPSMAVIAREADGGRLQPLAGVYPVSWRSTVEAQLASDDRSLHQLLARHDHAALPLPDHLLQNINTPEQWRAWLEE